MEGEAKTWLGSTRGTVFCVLSSVKLKLWVVHQQRKPYASICDFSYWVRGSNSHRHKPLVLRIQMRVQSQYEPRSPTGGTSYSLSYPSSSVCGAGRIPPNALQPTEAYRTIPAFGSPVHLQRRSRQTAWETSISERRNYGREMADQI
jgi:hypothetical protein